MLRRLGVPSADADDAAQQVFWIAARKIHAEPGPSDLNFLLAIALRVASDQRRARGRRREQPLSPAEDSAGLAPSPEDRAERDRALRTADRLLELLPWEQRVVFVLFELEEKSTQEIARLLEIPLGTVASRLRRARDAFRQAVARLRAAGNPQGGP
jgi:RNA polymerase sigma-70 factor (ECF subfamily)